MDCASESIDCRRSFTMWNVCGVQDLLQERLRDASRKYCRRSGTGFTSRGQYARYAEITAPQSAYERNAWDFPRSLRSFWSVAASWPICLSSSVGPSLASSLSTCACHTERRGLQKYKFRKECAICNHDVGKHRREGPTLQALPRTTRRTTGIKEYPALHTSKHALKPVPLKS